MSGPWVDVHAHPGRCFLDVRPAGRPALPPGGGETSDDAIDAITAAGMAAVSFATVTDLRVIGMRPEGGLYATREFEPGEVYADHRRQLDALAAIALRNGLAIVRTAADIAAAHRAKRPALFLTCEGADFIEGELDRLDEAHQAGVRSITIVHYRQNELGDLQTEPPLHHGLSAAGRQVVQEMNRLGMVVDLAHATFETTCDAVEVSSHPVMISHTHLRGRGDHPRLISEDHARTVAEAGGLVGAWPSGMASETFDHFVDEVARLAEVIGVGHVAIGTDMDANYKPVMTAYSEFTELEAGLLRRGFDQHEVDAILGGNAIDLIQTVCG